MKKLKGKLVEVEQPERELGLRKRHTPARLLVEVDFCEWIDDLPLIGCDVVLEYAGKKKQKGKK